MDNVSEPEKTENSKKIRTYGVRVMTFNMLSQDLISKKFFPFVDPEYLNPNTRAARFKYLLMTWMNANFIICLQEVNLSWYNFLKDIFPIKNYGFQTITYNDDKMGLCIAYPKDQYDLQKDQCGLDMRDVFIPGRYIKDRQIGLKNNGLYNDTYDDELMMSQMEEASTIETPLLSILLACKTKGYLVGKNLLVSTFHMPCKFTKKYLIAANIHAIKKTLHCLKHVWSAISKTPVTVVMTGDYNITPDNAEYKMLTGENYTQYELSNGFTEHGESLDFYLLLTQKYQALDPNLMKDIIEVRSAYKKCHDSEPPYTNVLKKVDSTFINCIDYILVDIDAEIRSSMIGLTVDNPHIKLYPNELCPSDHLPLSASLFI